MDTPFAARMLFQYSAAGMKLKGAISLTHMDNLASALVGYMYSQIEARQYYLAL
jgi:hypothetical protein